MNEKQSQNHPANSREVATLAGGCFWCLEAIFSAMKGVERAVSGYSGGATIDPSYSQVGTGQTGHAEAVQVTFDTGVLAYRDILEAFSEAHDPTTLNRQGADVGTQYRSAIFYHDERQKAVAEQLIRDLDDARAWDAPIVTEVTAFTAFYPAEDYHQDYFRRNPEQPYCRVVIAPKLAKLGKNHSDRLKG